MMRSSSLVKLIGSRSACQLSRQEIGTAHSFSRFLAALMRGILQAIFTQESSRIGPMAPLSNVAVTALATYYISESSSGTLILES